MKETAPASIMRVLGDAQRALARGDLVEAAAACVAATASNPRESAGFAMLALVRLQQNLLDAAAEAAQVAVQLQSGESSLLNLKAAVSLRQGRWHEALAASLQVLGTAPGDTRATADRIFALTKLAGAEDGKLPLDLHDLVCVSVASIPTEFKSIDAFNVALSDAICAHPALQHQGASRTLVQGSRLHDAFILEPLLTEALKEIFLSGERHWNSVVGLRRCPPQTRPSRRELAAWANVMPAGAYERPHIHESAWLSGVYYVAMPDPSEGSAGGLMFGGHDAEDGPPTAAASLTLVPEPGQVVIFPSYLYHRTHPSTAPGQRISIAFDVLPV